MGVNSVEGVHLGVDDFGGASGHNCRYDMPASLCTEPLFLPINYLTGGTAAPSACMTLSWAASGPRCTARSAS